MRPSVAVFSIQHYLPARALWERTPGVGLSAADEPEAIRSFLLRNPNTSFVATVDAQVVGTILCSHDGRRGLIHHLVVAPEYRRRGLGHQLLRAGLGALRAEGIGKCHILVFRNNLEGIAFWRAVSAAERTELSLFSLPTEGAA